MTEETPTLPCITAITPTLCSLMGAAPPAKCGDVALDPVVAEAGRQVGAPIEKCLVFAADAIGLWMNQQYPSDFQSVLRHAPLGVDLRSVMPSKTPVCYASMFTGTLPQVHGIQAYTKPVLTIETLFDSLVAANKRVAIVAIPDSSINLIFRNRPLDYFAESYDDQVLSRTEELLSDGRHDFILAYNQRYDDVMHQTTPASPEALGAMRRVVAGFDRLCRAMSASPWSSHVTAALFAPDHGAHIGTNGRGTHGENVPQDMLVRHYFGFHRGR